MDRTLPEGGLPASTSPPGLQAGPGITGETGESPPGPPPGPLDSAPARQDAAELFPRKRIFPRHPALRRTPAQKKPYIYKEMKNFFHETISTPIIPSFHHSLFHSLFLRKEPFICKDLRLSLSLSLPAPTRVYIQGVKKKRGGERAQERGPGGGGEENGPETAPGGPRTPLCGLSSRRTGSNAFQHRPGAENGPAGF